MAGDLSLLIAVIKTLNLVIGILLLVFVFLISNLFKGLEKLERPWRWMSLALFFFFVYLAVSTLVDMMVRYQVQTYLTEIQVIANIALTIFIGMVVFSLYLFKKGWEIPK